MAKFEIFRISRRIDEQLPQNLIRKVFFLPKKNPHYLILVIRSQGGDLGHAAHFVSLLNELKRRGTKVITIAYDFVSSAALPIFAAGDIRMTKSEREIFFFHRAEKTATVSFDELLGSENSAFKYMSNRFALSLEELYKIANEEKRIGASYAKDLGIVHKILEKTVV